MLPFSVFIDAENLENLTLSSASNMYIISCADETEYEYSGSEEEEEDPPEQEGEPRYGIVVTALLKIRCTYVLEGMSLI